MMDRLRTMSLHKIYIPIMALIGLGISFVLHYKSIVTTTTTAGGGGGGGSVVTMSQIWTSLQQQQQTELFHPTRLEVPSSSTNGKISVQSDANRISQQQQKEEEDEAENNILSSKDRPRMKNGKPLNIVVMYGT